MDIGTGKVPRDYQPCSEREKGNVSRFLHPYCSGGVRHYLLDVYAPTTPVNVVQFLYHARAVRKDISRRGRRPIICGGTLFWAQALAENHAFPDVKPDSLWRQRAQKLSVAELLEILHKLDPARETEILAKNEQKNRVRLIRAVEIARAGKSVLPQKKSPQNDNLIIAITPARQELYRKIAARFDRWLEEGILDEIVALNRDWKVSWRRLESFGLEYKWCARFLRGLCTAQEMREFALRDLRRYAKRQLVWLRRWQRQGAKIHFASDPKEVLKIADKFL